DELLNDRRVAPTEFRRLTGQEPAVVEQQPLPPTRPLRHMRDRPGTLERFACGREILVEECRELRPKRLDLGIKSQLHGTPLRSALDAPPRRQASAHPLWPA